MGRFFKTFVHSCMLCNCLFDVLRFIELWNGKGVVIQNVSNRRKCHSIMRDPASAFFGILAFVKISKWEAVVKFKERFQQTNVFRQ